MIALAKACERAGFCAPNPMVGAVIVHQNEVVVEENHYSCGLAHAEKNAIDAFVELGIEANDSTTLYVTLEPCNHWGKTPPCTNYIIESGIKKVIYAYRDPNPKVREQNTERLLQEKGVEVSQVEVEAINEFYQPYHYWTKTGKPFVTFKIAQSMDGKIASSGGKPFALTGEPLTTFTHRERLNADAILTTARTAINDKARLNVRLDGKVTAKPLIVLDSHLALTGNEPIFETAQKVYLIHSDKHSPQQHYKNTECVPMSLENGKIGLDALLTYLGHELGIHQLFVEAGGELFSSFILAKAINRAYVYWVPVLLGSDGVSVFASEQTVDLRDRAFVTSLQYDKQWVHRFDFSRED